MQGVPIRRYPHWKENLTRDVSAICENRSVTVETALLEREMYSEAEAARLLRVSQSTLHYWLEGGTYRHSTYAPVLRSEPTGKRTVTWAEFVEASLLRQYRRKLNVPLAELRDFINLLREEFGIPHPLAHERPWVAGRQLVIEAQDASGLPQDLWLVVPTRKQPLLLEPAQSFVNRVEFADDQAVSWKPHDDPKSPVVVDPDQRFGQPSVSGISTVVLWEHSEDDYASSEIAAEFGISQTDVDWAVSFEHSIRAA